jgi:hypothetical protein
MRAGVLFCHGRLVPGPGTSAVHQAKGASACWSLALSCLDLSLDLDLLRPEPLFDCLIVIRESHLAHLASNHNFPWPVIETKRYGRCRRDVVRLSFCMSELEWWYR